MRHAFFTRLPRFLPLLLLSCISTAVQAGAWLQPPKAWQTISSVTWFQSDDFVDRHGNASTQPDYTRLAYSPYLEYGWNDWLTLGANLQFEQVSQTIPGFRDSENAGIGDSEFFLRYRLWQEANRVVSIQPVLVLPSPGSVGFPAVGSPDGALELRLLAGQSLDNQGSFANAELGYRYRLDSPDDQWRLDVTAGYTPLPDWQLIGQLFSIWRVHRGDAAAQFISPGNDYDLVKAQLSATYALSPERRLQFGVFTHLYARNTGEGEGLLFAFWQEF